MTDAKKQSDRANEQFEKVEKGLGCHVYGHPHTRCHKCPYWGTGPHGSSECSVLAADALALIRQQAEKIHELQTKVCELQTVQTARVMTLEEAIEAVSKDGGIVWIEQKSHPLEVAHVLPTNHICDSPQRKFQDYGKKFVPKRYSYRYMWRCWTSWPTDEQRKAVKWDE